MDISDLSLTAAQEPPDDPYFHMATFLRSYSATLRHVLTALSSSSPPAYVFEALDALQEEYAQIALVIGDVDLPEHEKFGFDEDLLSDELMKVAVAEAHAVATLGRWYSEWLAHHFPHGMNGSELPPSLAVYLTAMGEEFVELVGSLACARMPRFAREKIVELQRGYSKVASLIGDVESGRAKQRPNRLTAAAKVLANLATAEWDAVATLNAWRSGWFQPRGRRARNHLPDAEGA